jgi:hypothetical protein
MKFKSIMAVSILLATMNAQASPSWAFKLPSQNLDAQYTVDIKAGPHIILTKIPTKGSFELWEGMAVNADASQYKICVFTFTDAWYTKPWYSSPDTIISSDGSFKFEIMTGDGSPGNTSQVSINLVPVTFETPIVTGYRDIPKSVANQSVFSIIVTY